LLFSVKLLAVPVTVLNVFQVTVSHFYASDKCLNWLIAFIERQW